MKQNEILEFFSCPILEDVVADKEWLKNLNTLVERFEVAKSAFINCDRFSKALCQNHPPFIQALILHALHELLSTLLASASNKKINNDDDDDDEFLNFSPLQQFFAQSVAKNQKTESPSDILKKWLPQIAYFLSEDERTVEVEVDGQLVALIKPGKLREESDMFLYCFSQELIKKMRLPGKMQDIFLPSYECTLKFSQLQTRKPLTKESEFVIASRKNGLPIFQHFPLKKNHADADSAFSGGIQEFIKPSTPSSLSAACYRTVLLFFVCLLGCRDLKSDGVIGYTIVDCEDYLEEKKGWTEAFPKIHVPFMREILNQPIDIDSLKRILIMMNRVDSKKLEHYVFEFDYEVSTTKAYHEDEEDAREGYVYPQPTYADNRLLSHEQISALMNNWQCLKEVLDKLIKEKTCTVHQMLAAFDPVWAESRDLFETCYLAAVEGRPDHLAFFREDQRRELTEFSRIYTDNTADDLCGSYSSKPPTPVDEIWRKRSSQSLSRSGSPYVTISPDLLHSSDPKNSDSDTSTSALNISSSN